MRKRTIKIFNPDKEYSIMEISQKTGTARRTIAENWKKYGLLIENGVIKGTDIIKFFEKRKNSKKYLKVRLELHEFYCMKTKQKVFSRGEGIFVLSYTPKTNRFKIGTSCFGGNCSQSECSYTSDIDKLLLFKIIPKKMAVGIYKKSPPQFHIEFLAKERIERRIQNDSK